MVNGTHRILAEHQYVERVMIFGQRSRNEPVIGGIKDRRIEHAVHSNQATSFIEFVFDIGPEGNLDYRIELMRDLITGTEIMPGV